MWAGILILIENVLKGEVFGDLYKPLYKAKLICLIRDKVFTDLQII